VTRPCAPIVLFALGDSIFAASLARRLGSAATALDLEAPLRGEPLTMTESSVEWQEVDLRGARALWIERPFFAWPQNLVLDGDERDRRALAQSAIEHLSETIPATPSPRAARLAAAQTAALDVLARAGIAVHPWRLETLEPGAPRGVERPNDVAGRVIGYEPLAQVELGPAWSPIDLDEPLITLLSIGGEICGALAHETFAAPRRQLAEDAEVDVQKLAPKLAELAREAARALDAGACALTAIADGSRAVYADLAVDWRLWDSKLDGRAGAACAAHLQRTVAHATETRS
jgi:hypothetical protein